MFNKRGQSGSGGIVIFIVGLIIVLVLGSLLVRSEFWNNWSSDFGISTQVEKFDSVLGKSFGWMTYIFGGIPTWLVQNLGENSAIAVTLFTWLLLFVTFGDIFAAFSTFSPFASWTIAFAMAAIFANLKILVVVLGFFIGAFSFLGGLAVLVGLAAAFVAFIAVNLGLENLEPWLSRRRQFMRAEKNAIRSEAGGRETAGAITGMQKIAEGFGKAAEGKR